MKPNGQVINIGLTFGSRIEHLVLVFCHKRSRVEFSVQYLYVPKFLKSSRAENNGKQFSNVDIRVVTFSMHNQNAAKKYGV